MDVWDSRTSEELWNLLEGWNGRDHPFWTTDPRARFFLGQMFWNWQSRRLEWMCGTQEPLKNCGIYWRVGMDAITRFGQQTLVLVFFWVKCSGTGRAAASNGCVGLKNL